MTDEVNAERVRADAHGFDTQDASSAYEQARPSYPAEAVAYIVGRGGIGPGRRVLDLAAGTGKLTRLLVPSGAEIVAVEPMAAMREQLRATVPSVEVRDGTAEDLPVADSSVDAVTAAQAFHWFEPQVALAQIHRVLRPGGHLFLLWNARDRGVDWVARYGDLLLDRDLDRPYDSYYDVDYGAAIASAGGFSPAEAWSHAWEQPFDADLLLARTESVSVVGAMPASQRAAVLDRVRHLTQTHPDLAGKATFPFPYTTLIWHTQAQ